MIHLVVAISTPLMLAATGGLMTKLAGVLNIGLEGMILVGAFAAILGASATGSAIVGLMAAGAAGTLFALIFAVIVLRLKANLFIAGLGINLLAVGATASLSSLLFSTRGVVSVSNLTVPLYRIPLVDSVPIIGEIVSGHTFFAPLAWIVVVAAALFVRNSTSGLELQATGIDEDVVAARGLNPSRYRVLAILFSGVTCGIAGAALSLELGAFVPNMSGGRGWIALVAVFLGQKRFTAVSAVALLFAAAEYGANSLQGTLHLPRTLALSVPYLVTLVGMVVFGAIGKAQARNKGE